MAIVNANSTYVNNIATFFRNVTLNAIGIERDFYQLMNDKDVHRAIGMCEDNTADVDNALSEYNPQLHKVMKTPNKYPSGRSPYITCKLPRTRQRYINEVELFFLLGAPIKWEKKDGDDEAFNDGQGVDRFWNVKTGKNWYYRSDAQGWTDDVDWEFEAFGESFPIINSFATEVNKDNLSDYYVGTETITVGGSDKPFDIDCWKFFVDFEDGTVIQYWVDPATGCTLKRQVNADPAKIVTVFDLKYTRLYFGPSFKKGLHDTRR